MESEAMRKDTGAFTEQSISMSTMKSSPAVRSRLSSMFAELTAGVRQDH